MDWLRRRLRPASPPPPPEALAPAPRHLAAARAALHAADAREALRQIALGIEADPGYLPLYKLVATTYALLPTGQNEWRLYAAVAERPQDPQAFFELGRSFIGTPNHATAIPLLERALALSPSDVPIVRELALALLGAFRPGDARDRLQAADLGDDPHSRFLLQHARFLSGETEGLPDYLQSERPRVSERLAATAEGPDREALQRLVERLDQLEESLARRAAVSDPGASLPAWHFVQYGAAILHLAGVPAEANAAESPAGRFGPVSLTTDDVDRIVACLLRLLAALDRTPEVIIALSDADSVRVAEVVARQSSIPLETLPSPLSNRSTRQMIEDLNREQDLLARPRTLVVAADNRRLERYPTFQTVLPGQTVFALAHHWPAAASLTPDISGLLCQTCVFPWTVPVSPAAPPAPRSRLSEPEPPPMAAPRKKEPPPPPAAVPEDPAAFDAAQTFYRDRAALLKGGAESGPRRWPFLRESPVPQPETH